MKLYSLPQGYQVSIRPGIDMCSQDMCWSCVLGNIASVRDGTHKPIFIDTAPVGAVSSDLQSPTIFQPQGASRA